jgi:hypothetical protein
MVRCQPGDRRPRPRRLGRHRRWPKSHADDRCGIHRARAGTAGSCDAPPARHVRRGTQKARGRTGYAAGRVESGHAGTCRCPCASDEGVQRPYGARPEAGPRRWARGRGGSGPASRGQAPRQSGGASTRVDANGDAPRADRPDAWARYPTPHAGGQPMARLGSRGSLASRAGLAPVRMDAPREQSNRLIPATERTSPKGGSR